MSEELYWLVLTAVLTALETVPYILERIMRIGLFNAMSYSKQTGHGDSNQPGETTATWARRAYRAHMNSVETLPIFTAIILAANLSGTTGPFITQLAMIYFFARVAHYLVYIFGVPILRTLAFATSLAIMLTIAWQVLTAI